MKIAVAIWLATARLQREHGLHADFPVAEIIRQAERECGSAIKHESLAAHVSSHCVATAKPSPDRYRMLTRTRRGHVRLFLPGDDFHPGRKDGATHPRPGQAGPAGDELITWYLDAIASMEGADIDPMLELREYSQRLGIWRGIDPDQYVEDLRAGWSA